MHQEALACPTPLCKVLKMGWHSSASPGRPTQHFGDRLRQGAWGGWLPSMTGRPRGQQWQGYHTVSSNIGFSAVLVSSWLGTHRGQHRVATQETFHPVQRRGGSSLKTINPVSSTPACQSWPRLGWLLRRAAIWAAAGAAVSQCLCNLRLAVRALSQQLGFML